MPPSDKYQLKVTLFPRRSSTEMSLTLARPFLRSEVVSRDDISSTKKMFLGRNSAFLSLLTSIIIENKVGK